MSQNVPKLAAKTNANTVTTPSAWAPSWWNEPV